LEPWGFFRVVTILYPICSLLHLLRHPLGRLLEESERKTIEHTSRKRRELKLGIIKNLFSARSLVHSFVQHVHKLPHQQGYLMVKKRPDIVTTLTLNFSPRTILLKWVSDKFFELSVVFIFPMSIGDMLGRRV
jgi:hypothetical protein